MNFKYISRRFTTVCFLIVLYGCVQTTANAGTPSSGVANFYSIPLPRQLFFAHIRESRDCMFVQRIIGKKKSRRIATICVERLNPREALRKNAFFVQDNSWVIGGSMDVGLATIEFKQESISIHGQASCGLADNAGIHAAGGLCYSFLTFSSHYAVSVQSTGNKNDIAEVASLAHSIVLAVKPSAAELRNVFSDASGY
jgi:hypothetical protein